MRSWVLEKAAREQTDSKAKSIEMLGALIVRRMLNQLTEK